MKTILFLLMIIPMSANAEDWRFQPDKQFHFTASAALTGALLLEPTYPHEIDMAIVMGLGLAKEIADTQKKGGYFSVADLGYDALGILSAYVTYRFLTIRW